MGGWAGVDIFFVLSGYLITSILLATRHASNYFSAFYARRALRIFPLYVVAVAAYFWIILPFAHRHHLVTGFRASEQLWYWTFLGNWRQGLGYNDGAGVAHFWSLAIEEQFYVLFSILVLYISGSRLVKVCAGMIAFSIVARIGLASAGMLPDLALRLTVLHLDPIAMGALLAASAPVRAFANRWSVLLLIVGGIGIYSGVPAGLTITAVGLGAAGVVGRACTQPVAFLRLAILRSLGKYSYAMYVIHGFLANAVNNLAKRHSGPAFTLTCLAGGTLVSYALAWLSWNLMEKWFLRLKRHFPYRMEVPTPSDGDPAEIDRHLIPN